MSQHSRVHGPDVLRGVASLAVCCFHLTAFTFPTPNGAFYNALKTSTSYGWLGVEVFFVISGFIIPYSLHRGGYKLKDYPTFILKRVVRLDPPYFVAIALSLLVAYLYSMRAGAPFEVDGQPVTAARVLWHLGYLNTIAGYHWLVPVFWTLAIEFQYYLVMGLLFPLVGSRRAGVRRAALVVLALACLAAGDWVVPGEVTWGRYVIKFTFLFLLGVLTYQYMTGLTRRREYVVGLALAFAGCVPTVGWPATLAGALAVAGIVFIRRVNPVADFFGRISYSLYLLHWLVGPVALSVASSKLVDTSGEAGKIVALLIAFGACVGASAVMYALVEAPAQRWSSRLKYGREGKAKKGEPIEVSGIAGA